MKKLFWIIPALLLLMGNVANAQTKEEMEASACCKVSTL